MTGVIQQDIHELTERIKTIRSLGAAGDIADQNPLSRMIQGDRRRSACLYLGQQWQSIERVVDRLRELEGE